MDAGVARAAARLRRAGCVAAELEAAELLAASTGPSWLEAALSRREHGEPLAWITGRVAFLGHAVRVDQGVYVPRAQSEELARRAAALLPADGRAADLCTGSGAVAVHLARTRPCATVVATDLDPLAAACAHRNGVAAAVADLGGCLATGAFDVVTAVAPYVPTSALRLLPPDVLRHEPRGALDGGVDGLDVVRRVVGEAARLLRPGGWLLTEVGGDQLEALAPTLEASGFEAPSWWADEDGDLRGVAARRGVVSR